MNILKSNMAIDMPVTTAGGTSAAAIATPTRIPGMSEDIAIPPANPRRIATTRNTGVISVLARISGVISNSVNDDAIAVNPAPIAIITRVKTKPDFAALYIFFRLTDSHVKRECGYRTK